MAPKLRNDRTILGFKLKKYRFILDFKNSDFQSCCLGPYLGPVWPVRIKIPKVYPTDFDDAHSVEHVGYTTRGILESEICVLWE